MRRVAIAIFLGFCCTAFSQAVRLDGRSNTSRLSNRLNSERLTTAEAKVETEKVSQKLTNAKVKQAPKQSTSQSNRAIRREQFDRMKKKKKIDIDRDDR